MIEISYSDAPVAVRDDLPHAHGRAWGWLAGPGSWWSGEERVSIAAEVRRARSCSLCRRRREALSPGAIEGVHESLGKLPPPAIDAIHRIVTDPGRLTKAWFARTRAAGLSDGAYVELVGVVVTVVSIDSFCRGIGVPLHPLPDPRPGAPSRYRPASARPEGAWVSTIPGSEARGEESDVYGGLSRVPNVIRALSLVPDCVRQLRSLSAAHYLSPEEMIDLRRGRFLDRRQIELVAARVSALRECFY